MGIHASNNQSACESSESSNNVGTTSWGDILGTITNQEDLIAYLESNYATPSTTPAYAIRDFGSAAVTNTAGTQTTNAEIVATINAAAFTITSGTLLKLQLLVVELIGSETRLVRLSFDFKRNNTAGAYGTGQTNGVIAYSDLILRNRVVLPTVVDDLEDLEIIDLGDIGASTIEDHLNGLPNDTHGLLDNGTVYYFDCVISDVTQTYQYVGALPADFGNDTSTNTDFDLIASSGITPPVEGGGTTTVIPQTEITTNTTISGTQKGTDKAYPINGAVQITMNKGTYAVGDVAIFFLRDGSCEFLNGTDVRLTGPRTIDNEFHINDKKGYVFLHCEALDGDVMVVNFVGNTTRGYTGEPTISSVGTLREGDTAVDVPIVGTGFSENMTVTVSANATQSSAFTFVDHQNITAHLTAVGVEDDTADITIDNGDVVLFEDAITIASDVSVDVLDNHDAPYAYALFRLRSSQTYCRTIRRSSDNAVTNLGFLANGKIGLNAPVSAGGDLTTWAGSDDVFTVTKLNQGSAGSDYDLTQSDPDRQAKLLNAGALITVDGRIVEEVDGVDDGYETANATDWANNDLTIFADVRSKSTNTGVILIQFDSGVGTNRALSFQYNDSSGVRAGFCNEAGSATFATSTATAINTTYDAVAVSNATHTRIYIDGVAQTAAAALANKPTENLTIQSYGRSPNEDVVLDGYASYIIMYTSNKEADIAAIKGFIDLKL